MHDSIGAERDPAAAASDRATTHDTEREATGGAPGRASPGPARGGLVPGRVRIAAPELATRIDRREQTDAQAHVDAATSSTGRPLPDALRQRFESSLGQPLDDVRVHDGRTSGLAASSLGARAFALGRQVHLGGGGADADPHVLAHEVAHVAQQAGRAATPQMKLLVGAPDDPLEHEADVAADAMLEGRPVRVSTGAAPAVRRLISVAGEERPRYRLPECKWLGFWGYFNDPNIYYDFASEEALNTFIETKGTCGKTYKEVDAKKLKEEQREREQRAEQERQRVAAERRQLQGAEARDAVDGAWQRDGQLDPLRARMEDTAQHHHLKPSVKHEGNHGKRAMLSATALTVIANAIRQRVVDRVGPAKGNIVVVTGVVWFEGKMLLLIAGNGGFEAKSGLDELQQVVGEAQFEGIDKCIPVIDKPHPGSDGSNRISASGKSGKRDDDPTAWHGEQKLIAYAAIELGPEARASLTCVGIAHPDGPCHEKTFATQHCDQYLEELAEDPDRAVAAAWFQGYKPNGGALADEVLDGRYNDGHRGDGRRDNRNDVPYDDRRYRSERKEETTDERYRSETKDNRYRSETKEETKDNRYRSETKDNRYRSETKDNRYRSETKDNRYRSETEDDRYRSETKDERHNDRHRGDGRRDNFRDDSRYRIESKEERKNDRDRNDERYRNESKHDRDRNESKHDRDRNGSKHDRDRNESKHDRDRNGSKHDRDRNESKRDRDRNESKHDRDRNGSKHDRDRSERNDKRDRSERNDQGRGQSTEREEKKRRKNPTLSTLPPSNPTHHDNDDEDPGTPITID